MKFKELDRWLQSQQITEQENPAMEQLLQRVRNKPFFLWWDKDHKHIVDSDKYVQLNDCWNCIMGWPTKGTKRYPLFNYEEDIIKAIEIPNYVNVRKSSEEDDRWYEEQRKKLEQKAGLNKEESVITGHSKLLQKRHERLIHLAKVGRVCILKSRGLGVTTLLLRYIAYICTKNDELKGTDICLITGPREQLSIDLINRLKQLFLPFDITFETKETTLFLNGVRIRSFPSNNISAMRGLASVSFIYADEAAFFDKNSQTDVIDAIEGYAGKSQSKIVLTSTPNKVGDLMHTILSQPFDQSFYKILKLNYEWGVGKIYQNNDLMIAKMSSSFEREYNLSFNSPEGNSFSHVNIDKAVELGKKYPDVINKDASHVIGCDPGFGSSNFALVCLEHSDSKIKVVYARQFKRSGFNDMIQEVWNIRNMVGSLDNVYVDMANTEFIEALKQDFGDDTNWQRIHDTVKRYQDMNLRIEESNMKVIPVSFSKEGASMLVHVKNLLDHEDNLVVINPKYTELIAALKGAVSVEYRLDKKESVFSDLTDAFRLAAKYFGLER